MINGLMGNDRWILRTLERFPEVASRGITEIGAGDGTLIRKITSRFLGSPVTAVDLAPKPPNVPEPVIWKQDDLFQIKDDLGGGILVANLFLHHFEGEALQSIGDLCSRFEVLVFSEPARGKLPHLQGKLLHPLVNHVTRHDMHISIDAGFIPNELPGLLGLPSKRWQIQETSTWRGASRMVACQI